MRFLAAMLLAGALCLLAVALIALLFWAWAVGQWWWSLLALVALSAWAFLATRTEPGEKRNDFGV